jgi:hypothetical protein
MVFNVWLVLFLFLNLLIFNLLTAIFLLLAMDTIWSQVHNLATYLTMVRNDRVALSKMSTRQVLLPISPEDSSTAGFRYVVLR